MTALHVFQRNMMIPGKVLVLILAVMIHQHQPSSKNCPLQIVWERESETERRRRRNWQHPIHQEGLATCAWLMVTRKRVSWSPGVFNRSHLARHSYLVPFADTATPQGYEWHEYLATALSRNDIYMHTGSSRLKEVLGRWSCFTCMLICVDKSCGSGFLFVRVDCESVDSGVCVCVCVCVCVRKPLINPVSTIHEATSFRAEYFVCQKVALYSSILVVV